MSGAYVFIHEGDVDYAFSREKGLPLEELGQTSRRAPLIHLDNFRLAEIVAIRLQQEAGLSQDDCETFREFKAIRQANLSKEDIALAMEIDSQNRPEWLKPWVHRARQIVGQIRPFLQDDKAAHQANDRRKIPKSKRKTMTFDNGKEFAGFKALKKSVGFCCYFADPYSSYQRGTNENTNGLLRQFFPKGTDFNEFSEEKKRLTKQRL